MAALLLLSGCGKSDVYTVKTKTELNGNSTVEYYDSEGKKIKRESVTPEGEIKYVMDYFYDDEDRLIKSGYAYEGYWQTTEYTYDEKGNNTLAVISDSDGYRSEMEYAYDENGWKKKTVITNSDGRNFTIKYTYDEMGNLIKEKETSADGNEYTTIYTNDENGNKIKKETTDLTGYKNVTEYTYDEKGNVITKKEASSFMNGEYPEEDVVVYTYDENNNLIREERSDPEGNVRVEEYSYSEETVKELTK